MPACHWHGYPRRSSCCRCTRAPAKSGLLLSILVERPQLGKQSPLRGTFKTCFLAEDAARFLFLTGLCCWWRASCRYLKTMWKDKQESHARYPHIKYLGNANEWGRKRKIIKANQEGFQSQHHQKLYSKEWDFCKGRQHSALLFSLNEVVKWEVPWKESNKQLH